MLRALAVLALALLAFPAQAQEQTKIPLALRHDLDETANYRYCNMAGPFTGEGLVSSSSTTITAASAAAFSRLVAATDSVGSVIVAAGEVRRVVTYTDATHVVVDTAPAVAWASSTWYFYQQQCGTGANDGWVNVSGYSNRLLTWELAQGTGDTFGIDVVWECRQDNLLIGPTQIWPSNSTAVDTTRIPTNVLAARKGINANIAVEIPQPFHQCRVGSKWHTADDGADTGANQELLNILFTGYTQR